MKRVEASVTTLTPSITQNKMRIDWEKASRTIAGPSVGVITSNEVCVEAKMLAWIAPRIDTPIAPPRLRVNVARPDAMPISPLSTEFWNATIVDGIIIPLPNPSGIPMTMSCRREGDGRTEVRNRSALPANNDTSAHELQANVEPPRNNPSMRRPRKPTNVDVPSQSLNALAFSARDSFKVDRMRTSETTPTGRLM